MPIFPKLNKSKLLNSTSVTHLQAPSQKKGLGLQALEQRILLDAAAFATGAEAVDVLTQQQAEAAANIVFETDHATSQEQDPLLTALRTISTQEDSKETLAFLSSAQVNPSRDPSGDQFTSLKVSDGSIGGMYIDPIRTFGFNSAIDIDNSPLITDGYNTEEGSVFMVDPPEPEFDLSGIGAQGEEYKSVVFVDTAIDDYQTLIDGLPLGIEIVLIDATQDGIEQMAEWFVVKSDYDAVHVLSHGGVGQVNLGTGQLTLASLTAEYADEMSIMQNALSADADLLIYGCDVGKNTSFVTALADATGADIAASTDDTGAIQYGGDWDLELKIGQVEAGIIVSVEAQSAFENILADTDGDGVDDLNDIDDDNDGILDINEQDVVAPTGVDAYFTGTVSLSVDGTYDTGNVTINRPVGATLLAAFVVSFDSPDNHSNSSPITVNNIPVPLPNVETSSLANGFINRNLWGDVTGELEAVLNALPTGDSTLTLSETSPTLASGSALVVVWDNPAVVDGYIALNFSSLRTSQGSNISIPIGAINTTDPNFSLTMGLGISHSASGPTEITTVNVNGGTVTTTAGGFDDGVRTVGRLITVGGEGDLIDSGAEIYDVSGFVSDGDTSIDITTSSSHAFDYLGLTWIVGTGIDPIVQSRDTDSDGIDDHLDLDSDNDGITDNIEAQTTANYIAPNIDDEATLIANAGLNSAYVATNGLAPVDTDNDGDDDYLDTDSDNEGDNDTTEAGLIGVTTGLSSETTDADGDGLFDIFDTQNGTLADDGVDPNESLAAGAAALPDSDNDANGALPFVADVDFRDANIAPSAMDDGDTTPIAITGNVPLNIDVLINDTDGDGDTLTITNIYDPVAPSTAISIATGEIVTLASGTQIEYLVTGELRVTTSPLAIGLESFIYEIYDGTESNQATVSLTRSQGSLFSVAPNATGTEDTPILIPVTIDPALISGGDLPNTVETAIGFHDASAGTTPTTFDIPANVTGITVTAIGGYDNGTANATQEEFISGVLNVDLVAGTYSGHDFVSYGYSQRTSDNFAFRDVALGDAASSGLVAGERAQGLNNFTVDVNNGVLSIVSTNTLLDQAYLVEFQTSDGSSMNLLQIFGEVQTPTELSSSFNVGTDASVAIINMQGGRDSSSTRDEDKAIGRIIVDYDTGLVSGTIFSQTGRGDNHNVAYAFEGYDLNSGLSIFDLASGATIVGDDNGSSLNLHELTITQVGDDLTITRASNTGSPFEILLSVETYERVDAGSAAFTLGSEAVSFTHIQNPNVVTTFDLPVAQGAETANITMAMSVAGSSTADNDNENTGTARIIVDFENGTTSGTFIGTRADSPDLLTWSNVPFGTRLFDHVDTISNHATIGGFTDEFAAVLSFDLVTNPDGSVILQGTAQVEPGAGTGSYANYAVVAQAVYSGRAPIEISGFVPGGTFNVGSLNAETGNWEVDAADLATLEFLPSEHFSGNTQALVFDYRGDAQSVNVDVSRVADAPTLVTTDFSGTENTTFAIHDAVIASLVDQDGSETLTVTLENISIGHTVSDGVNSFTAVSGNQNIDITTWDISALTYTPAADIYGEFTLDVRASTSDVDGFSSTADTAETLSRFTINVIQDTDSDGVADNVDIDDDNDGILDVEEGFASIESLGLSTTESTLSFIRSNANIVDPRAEFNDVLRIVDGNQSSASGLVFNGTLNPGEDTVFVLGLNVIEGDVVDTFELRASVRGLNDLDVRAFDLNIRDMAGSIVFSTSVPDTGPTGTAPATVTGFSLTEGFYTVEFIPQTHGASSSTVSRSELIAAEIAELSFVGVTNTGMQIAALHQDTDNDGIADHLDLDSDNDGITDNIEAQRTIGYIAPNADDIATYSENSGLNSAYVATNGLAPVNSDMDDTPDYLDTDSDNDGEFDIAEAGFEMADADGDGRVDIGDGPDMTPNTGDEQFSNIDVDGDGLADAFDTQGGTFADDGYNSNESLATGALAYPDKDNDAADDAPLTADVDFRDAVTTDQVPSLDLNVVETAPTPGQDGFAAFSFSAPTIVNDGQSEVADGIGNGETALYANVGFFNGQSVDLRATVIENNANTNPTFGLSGASDNANVNMDDASSGNSNISTVRWEIIESISGVPVAANFTLLITDLDNTATGNDEFEGERISISEGAIDGYVLEDVTDIVATLSNGVITFQPTDNDPGTAGQDPTNAVQLVFSATSSFEITYDRSGAANFSFDGNFTPIFNNAETVDTNVDFLSVFTENGGPVNIAAQNATVDDFTENDLTLLTITPGNIFDGTDERLIFNGDQNTSVILPLDGSNTDAQTLTIDSVEVSIQYTNGTIEISPIVGSTINQTILNTLLQTATYEHISENPTGGLNTDRSFTFQVTDVAGQLSNTAISVLTVLPLNDAPSPELVADPSGTVVIAGTGNPTAAITLDQAGFAATAELTGEMVRTAFSEGQTASDLGLISVADLLADFNIEDIEDSEFGIAIELADETQGRWQYLRTDLPTHEWTDFQLGDVNNTDVNPVPEGQVLLMDADAVFRFVADPTFTGETVIDFRVWDTSEGIASNPPSTFGSSVSNSSSFSSTVFSTMAASAGVDTDGDSILDVDDLDDDNDGILDSIESPAPNSVIQYDTVGWFYNDFPNISRTPVFDPSFIVSANPAFSGPGVIDTLTTSPSSSMRVDGATATSYSGARASEDYVQFEFTTGNLNPNTTVNNISIFIESAIGGDGTAALYFPYEFAIEISADANFSNAQTILTDAEAILQANRALIEYPTDEFALEDNTQYFIRAYIYNVASPSSAVIFDDFIVRFNENDAPLTRDTDGDGIADHLDLDSDNDGISDLEESGQNADIVDTNNDGIRDDMATPADQMLNDLNDDGISDAVAEGSQDQVIPRQTDSDGVADYRDLDSDADGIADAIEARLTTTGNVITTGGAAGDTDRDGVLDHFDTSSTFGGTFVAPIDTDSASSLNNNPDGIADYIDTDSDGDGILDSVESGLTALPTNVTYMDADGTLVPALGLANFVGNTSEVAFRELNVAPIADLNDDTTTAARDHIVTVETSAAISVNPIAANGGVFDTDSSSISQLIIEIEEAGFVNASDEYFVIGGEDISLDSDSVTGSVTTDVAITINGNNYTIRTTRVNSADPISGGPSVVINILQTTAQGDGQIPLADMNAILQSLTYRNDAGLNATSGNRVYTVRAIADQVAPSTNSNIATGTIAVTNPDPVIDLNDDNTTANLNVANIFTEGDAPLAIANMGEVLDEENDIIELEIVVGGLVDGNDEVITLSGEEFSLGTDKTVTITNPTGDNVEIAYVNGTFTITNISSPGEAIPVSLLTNFLQTMTYNHESDDPTIGNRTLTFTAEDKDGNSTKTSAVATITVREVNQAPAGADATITATEDTNYTFAAADFGFTDIDNNMLESITIQPLTGNGTLSLNGTEVLAATTIAVANISNLVYAPDENDTGANAASFDFVVTDNGGTDNSGHDTDQSANRITINISAVDDNPVIDLNDNNTTANLDFASSFSEGGGAVAVSDSDADIFDPENDITTLTIIIGGVEDGASEVISIAGQAFPANADATLSNVTVGSSSVNIAYIASTGRFTITNTLGTTTSIDQADLDVLLRGITYENTSPDLTEGNRTLTFSATDTAGLMTVTNAVATISVAAVDNPIVIVDPNTGQPASNSNDVVPAQMGTDNILQGDLDISPYFQDLDDTLSFSAANLPDGLTIDAVTGVISGMISTDASVGGDDPAVAPGIYTVVVTADDGHGGTASTNITYTISNPTPIALNDPYTTNEDTAFTIDVSGVLDNDTDPDGDTLFVSAVAGLPSNVGEEVTGSNGGVFTINPDGSIAFDPAGDFENLTTGQSETTSLEYTVSDGQGGTQVAMVTVTVDGVDDPAFVTGPLGTQTGVENGSIAPIDTSTIFNNPNGETLTYTVENLPPGLNIDPSTGIISGTITHTASLGGPYSVTVTATTPSGETSSTNFVYNVSNPAPEANDDRVTTLQDQSVILNPLVNDNDPDGDALMVSGTGATSNGGTVTVHPDGTLSYTPATGFTGTDIFTYTVDDGQGGTDIATITVTVGTPPADAPTTIGVSDQMNIDGENVNFDPTSSFNEPNGQALTYGAIDLPPGLSMDPVTGLITGTIDPSASQAGPYNVTLTATDPDGNTISTQFVWNVRNPAPEAGDDNIYTPENTAHTLTPLGNDGDVDGDALSIRSIDTVSANGGMITLNPDGSVTYTPPAGFVGTDSFTYIVSDENGATDTATVTVEVGPAMPAGYPEVTSTPMTNQTGNDGEGISPLDVTGSFMDPDGDPLIYAASGLPEGLEINPNTGLISGTIDPSASQSGPYTVTVTATDPDGNTATTQFVYAVSNPAPMAENNTAATLPGAPVVLNVLNNDTDIDGDMLTVTSVTAPQNGTVVINPDGTLTYTPNAGYEGMDQFTYTIQDGQGGTDTATVNIEVSATPSAFGATGSVVNQSENDGATITPINLSNFVTDPEGGTLTFAVTNLPTGLNFDPLTGVISGTIDRSASRGGPNNDGIYPVVATITDPSGNETPITFLYTVTNTIPNAMDDGVINVNEDTSTPITVLVNDTDADGDPIIVTEINGTAIAPGGELTLPSGSVVRLTVGGSITYEPATNLTGPDSFTYTIDDGEGGTDTATVNLALVGVNDGPQTDIAISNQMNVDGDIISLDISGNFSDIDDTDLSYSATDLPPGLSINPDAGIISGTLPGDASVGGPYTVIITVTDPDGLSVSEPFIWDVDNITPVVVALQANQTNNDGESVAIDITGVFSEPSPDSDILTYAASGLPEGLSIDPATGIITGTIASDASLQEPYTVTLTADDGQGGIATESFIWSVNNTNPGLLSQLGNQAHQDGETISPVNVSTSFEDVDGDPLTFTAMGLPPGVSIDPNTGIITGTLPKDASLTGPYTVLITATDPQGDFIVDTFVWEVSNTPPEVVNPQINLTLNDGEVFSLNTAPNFDDGADDTDVITYTATGLPAGLRIDPMTGEIQGTIDSSASLNGPFTVEVTATDEQGDSTSDVFVINVENINPDVPTLPEVSGEAARIGAPFFLSVATTDPDNDQLTYRAEGLPDGLTIDPATGEISGTPTGQDQQDEPYNVTITVDDGEGGVVNYRVGISVLPDDALPIIPSGGEFPSLGDLFERKDTDDGGATDGYYRESNIGQDDIFAAHRSTEYDMPRHDFIGGVLRFQAPGYQGELVLEGVATNKAVYLELSETLSQQDNVTVVKWHVAAHHHDGEGLPSWIDHDAATDVVVLNRIIGTESYVLHIHALTTDNRVISGDYEVNLRTGDVSLVGQATTRVASFAEQLEIQRLAEHGEERALFAALGE